MIEELPLPKCQIQCKCSSAHFFSLDTYNDTAVGVLQVLTFCHKLVLKQHLIHHTADEGDPLNCDLQTLQSDIFVSENHGF